jgi:anaphase-promoting complex subunit 1
MALAVRTCISTLALACAVVMAGTGNLDVLKRVRRLHGRLGSNATVMKNIIN